MNTKKKEKTLNSVLGVNVGIPSLSETGFAVFTAETVIGAYEKEAREILARGGYPLTFEDLWHNKEKFLPDLNNGKGLSQVYSIFWMLWYLEKVRFYVQENNADQATCHMAVAGHWAITAKLKPIAHLFDFGAGLSKRAKITRGKREKWGGLTKVEISTRNQKIREQFKISRLTASSFATKHAKEFHLRPRTIRDILS